MTYNYFWGKARQVVSAGNKLGQHVETAHVQLVMSPRDTTDFAMHCPSQLARFEALEVVALLQQHADGIQLLGHNKALQREPHKAWPRQQQRLLLECRHCLVCHVCVAAASYKMLKIEEQQQSYDEPILK
jgi:hypothetical protein